MGVPPLQTFQQPGPLDQAAKALQFKQMMGNQQIQQQQIQEGDIGLQQKQQDMKDQQTIRQLFIKNQGDMDKTLNDAISAGVKPQTVQSIKASVIDQKTKLATLDENTLKATKARAELYGQTTGAILALAPEKRKQAAMDALPGLVQQGVVKPEEAQGLMQQLPQMDDMALDQFLKLHQYSAMATDKQLDEIRKAKESAIKQPGEIGDSIEKSNKAISQTMGGTTNPAAWKAKRAFLAQRGMDVSQVPEEFSPEAVQQMKSLGMPGYVKPEHVTMAEGVFTTNADGTPNKRIGSPVKALQVNTGTDQPSGPPDKDSNSILAQTGLSMNAFKALTGKMTELPRDAKTRNAATQEAQKWANKMGIDISTMTSQYKSYNEVLASNIDRMNRTKIMEDELVGTVDNLKGVVKQGDLGQLRWPNVLKVWAGQEVNDDMAQQYAMHLGQLRNELAAYYAATQGRSGNNITITDQREAEQTIKSGISTGGLNGMKTAIQNSTDKMGKVMERSVDSARHQVWNLFGVGKNYKNTFDSGGDQSGGKGGGQFSVSVGTKTYTFKDQQSLDNFKRDAGIK